MTFVALSNAAISSPLLDWDSETAEVAAESAPEPVTATPMGNAVIPNPVELGGAPSLITQDPEYRVGALDVIKVEVFLAEELDHLSRVDADGDISLPLIGRLNVNQMSVEEIETFIEDKLREKYMQDPHVTVTMVEYKSQTITMEGWVKSPGVYPLTSKTTFLQAIAKAKGMDKMADFNEVAIFRHIEGKGIAGYIVDYNKIRSGELVDPVLKNGDVIVVSRSGSKAAWAGAKDILDSFIGWRVFF